MSIVSLSLLLILSLLAINSSNGFSFSSSPTSAVRTSLNYSPRMISTASSSLARLRASVAPSSSSTTPASSNAAVVPEDSRVEVARINKILEAEMAKVKTLQQTLDSAQMKLDKLQELKTSYLNDVKIDSMNQIMKETTTRSAVKSLGWRLIAGIVTLLTAMKFSGSVKTALSIVSGDFLSKSFTMFIGERVMNKSQAGRAKGGDDVGRSLAKALIWRVFAICNTLTMSFFFAKDLSIASKIASSDAVIKTALMFFYERAWANIEWGKEYDVEFTI